MIISRSVSVFNLLKWTGHHFVWLILFIGSVSLLYYFNIIAFKLPWIPVSVVGTAVAFYVGFKNNQAYDRMWEARKIWGGIINDSRSWGMYIDGYISNLFSETKHSTEYLLTIKKRLIYRHIAWLYAHRSQLLISTPWEHASQRGMMGKTAKYYQKRFGIGLYDDDITKSNLEDYLPEVEYDKLVAYANTATQIINEQSRDLQSLRENNIIDDFRHVELVSLLKSFYTLQGKNERIKKFPLPRQYANISRYFVGIFIFLLPFSIVPQLAEQAPIGLWLAIPVTVIIGWIYIVMEIVGDYTENPFQGMANDIPMMSLCRTIEIDLRQMLNDKDIPEPIKAKGNILM
jgi:putative membrane protein